MVQRGDEILASSWTGRAADLLWLKLVVLRDEVLVGSRDLARIGLVGIALTLQTIVLFSPGHFRPAGIGAYAVQVSVGTLGALLACFLAAFSLKGTSLRLRQGLGTIALVSLFVLSFMGVWHTVERIPGIVHGTPYTNDGAVMDLYAASKLRHLHNPYLKTNIVTALAAINAPSITTTPLMDGEFRGARAYPTEAAVQQVFLSVLRYRPHSIPAEFESKYCYPAGSFLFILPFVWAGIQDMRFFYALIVALMAVYLWFRLPRSLRILAPAAVLANVPLLVLTTGGQPDPLYGIFLMVALGEWTRSRVSPVSMGIAAGIKQLTWFFLPFYLLLTFHRFGWREAARRGAIVGGIFALMNGPFILLSPSAWLASVTAPMTDPMFPLGVGIIALSLSEVVPMAPKIAFTVAEMGAWLGGAAAFMRWRALPVAVTVALATLPLFFAWRSLVSYFYLAPLLTLAVMFAPQRAEAPTT